MSYDLSFLRPRSVGALPPDAVRAYFGGRPNFRLNNESGEAFYANDRTGVYFAFQLTTPETDDEEVDGWVDAGVTFHLNYFRPHIFGLEANVELTAFVQHFEVRVDDPQMEGMGRGEFSTEGFFRGWNCGNGFAYKMTLEHPELPKHQLPSAELERLWTWNYRSQELQTDKYGDDVFVPRIFVANYNGRVVTYTAWPDAISIALPRTDFVVMARHELAKRRFFGLLPGKMETFAVPWSEIEALVKLASQQAHAAGTYYLFDRLDSRPSLVEFFKKPPAGMPTWEQLSWDSLLTEELLAQFQKA